MNRLSSDLLIETGGDWTVNIWSDRGEPPRPIPAVRFPLPGGVGELKVQGYMIDGYELGDIFTAIGSALRLKQAAWDRNMTMEQLALVEAGEDLAAGGI